MRNVSQLLLLAFGLAACQGGFNQNTDAQDQTKLRDNNMSGARLTVTLLDDTDVVGFHFEVTRVACSVEDEYPAFSIAENVALDDTIFPGQIQFLEEAPLDSDSAHMGADFFVPLDPGCYVVTASPASAIGEDSWVPSAECSTATSDPLDVVGGYTTETVLISQCEGETVGAVDALIVLNTPPTVIPNIENKYNNQCEPVEVCAQAWDPNDDPVEFEFDRIAGPEFYSVEMGDKALIGYENGHRLWEQCATYVSEDIADYMIEIRAYDMAYNEAGELVRIEDLISLDSHGWFQVPIHTGWTQSDACIDEDGEVVTSYSEPVCPRECVVTSDEDYYCSGDYEVSADIVELICDGTDLLEDVLYPTCE